MKVNLLSLFDDLVSLIYPRLCKACGLSLYLNEEMICTRCKKNLPLTNFHLYEDTPADRVFYGRIKIQAAAARFFFRRGSRVQHLMHLLKYKGNKDIGIYMGKIYGQELIKSHRFSDLDVIIPVPLHPARLKKRGYNQAAVFAYGLAEGMKIPVVEHVLVRELASETQTRKSRLSRWENVKSIFAVYHTHTLENKHILLVDDVITTGATLEACAQMLSEIPGIRISIAALAIAGKEI